MFTLREERARGQSWFANLQPRPQPLGIGCSVEMRARAIDTSLLDRLDFERMAAGTNTNWRDVVDLAMDTMLKDPDELKPARGDQTCRTRVLFVKDFQSNQVVRQQQFEMFTYNGSNEIATAFPDNRRCE